MEMINVLIDGRKATGAEGESILEVSRRMGLDIPTLCHRDELKPTGVCRACVVEVEGSSRLVASCHTPIAAGMVIRTDSPKVLLSRKMTLELLIAGHSGTCVVDPYADVCQLHQLASKVELEVPRFSVTRQRSYPVEENNPYVVRDLSNCILCMCCVGACEQIAKQSILAVGYRGINTKIIVGADGPLDSEACRDCGICVDYCPTSALRRSNGKLETPGRDKQRKSKKPKAFKKAADCEGILAELKKEQLHSNFVSESAMRRLKDQFGTTLGEVYGLASFYSFLSTKPTGRNVIRVCRSLPCFLKNGEFLLNVIKKSIGILPGETTKDERFSLEFTNCIGACDKAPTIMVNHDIHGELTDADIPDILASYK